MAREQRAEVAFKIAGIGFIAYALAKCVWTWESLSKRASLLGAIPAIDGWRRAFLLGYPVAVLMVPIAIGFLLILLARPLSAALYRTEEPVPARRLSDLLRLGIMLLGIMFVWSAIVGPVLGLITRSFHEFHFAYIPLITAALVFTARPRRLASEIYPCIAPSEERRDAAADTLALGIVVLCLWFIVRYLGDLALTLEWTAGRNAWTSATALGDLLSSTVSLVVAIPLIRWAGGLAGWFMRRRGARRPDASAPGEVGGRACIGIAVFVGVAYAFGHYIGYLTHPPFLRWEGPPAVAAVLYALVVPAAVAFLLFHLAGWYAWKIAAWMWPAEPADREGSGKAVVLWAEVGVTVIALYLATNCALYVLRSEVWRAAVSATPSPHFRVMGYSISGLACVAMLVLRSDIAWLLCPSGASPHGISQGERADLLRPWLVLLGLWYTLGQGPGSICWGVTAMVGGQSSGVPYLGLLAGLPLVLAAPWISWKLSYGPLIPAIRRRFRYGGG